MKIVYILEQFYLHGGAEKITAQKVNWLIDKGYDVFIIVSNQQNKPFVYPLDKRVHFIDLQINYISGKSYFHPNNLIKVPKHFYKLKKTLKKINPDVTIILSLQFDYYFLPFITKAKTIKEFHSSRYFYDENRKKAVFLKRIKYAINDYIEKKYNHLVVLTSDEVQHYKSKNISVIPNGIKLDDKEKATLSNKVVIAAGRIAPVKNFEDLIDIWSVVSKKFPDWQLKIYGEGEKDYVDKLQTKIVNAKLSNNCCLCGSTNNLTKKMKKASIYVMTSHTECYPMVLLEAKNIGLPIISYNCPYGPKNIINNEIDGILVPDKNKKELIMHLENLIRNNEKRIKFGSTAKINIKKNDINFIMTKWLKLFKTI